jgi:aminoglycoside phosphotransferase (APT) family kinase protein
VGEAPENGAGGAVGTDGTDGADPAAVARWLADLGVAVSGPLTLTRVGLGQSNLTYAVADTAGARWVLRRPPLGRLLASAHDVAREARILSALRDTDVPVPGVLGVREEDGVPLVLMEFVEGDVLDRLPAVSPLPPQTRHAIGLSLARTLARVHAVDLAATGLTGIAGHKPYAERQLRRWSTQWEKSRTRDLPELDELTARLVAAVPPQRELTLVHGDFHLRNVIVSAPRGEVVSVLDWELCTLGDPLADLGTLLAYWPQPGEVGSGVLSLSSQPGFPTREELAAAYLAASGRDGSALGFWHALGLWKIAIIAEGVLRRALDEPRNRAAALTPTAEQVDALVARSRAVADEAGI